MRKQNKGITLVALVVTIIILLILAGITINVLDSENGLFAKAKQSREKNAKAQAEEDIILVLHEWKMEKNLGKKTFAEFLDSKVKSKEIDDYEVLDGEDGNIEIYKNGYFILVDSDGNIIEGIQKSEVKPKVSNISIKLGDGTEPTDYSQEVGTPLVISFDAEIEGGNITSIDPSVPYKTDGTEIEKKFVVTGKVGNDYYTKTITVNLKNKYKLKKPVITPSTTEWTNQDITVEVDYGNIDSTYTKEISIDGGKTYNLYTGAVTVRKNTIIKARIKGTVEVDSELEISNIDKLEPKDFTPTVLYLASSTEFTINANATDTDATNEYGRSGIKEYQYYVYKESKLIDKSEKINSSSWKASGMEIGSTYDIYVEVWDKAGEYKKSETINYTKSYEWKRYKATKTQTYDITDSGLKERYLKKNTEFYYKENNKNDYVKDYVIKTEDGYQFDTSSFKEGRGSNLRLPFIATSETPKNEMWVNWGLTLCGVGSHKGEWSLEYVSYVLNTQTSYSNSGVLIDIVKSSCTTEYPENGYQGDYWYVKLK